MITALAQVKGQFNTAGDQVRRRLNTTSKRAHYNGGACGKDSEPCSSARVPHPAQSGGPHELFSDALATQELCADVVLTFSSYCLPGLKSSPNEMMTMCALLNSTEQASTSALAALGKGRLMCWYELVCPAAGAPCPLQVGIELLYDALKS